MSSAGPSWPAWPAPGAARRRLTRGVVWSVGVAGAAILAWSLPGAISFATRAPSGFWAMTVAALLVDVPLFGMSRRSDMRVRSTLSVCFTVAILVLWGGAAAIVVQALAAGVTVIGQRYHPTAGVYLVARLVCAAFAAALVEEFGDPQPITSPASGLNGGDLLSFLLIGGVWFAVSYGLLALARATVSPRGLRQATAEMRYDVITTSTSVLVISPVLTTVPGWWALLFVVPLIVWNRLSREQMSREERLGREPVSGMLNRHGLDIGMKSITGMDTIEPAGPRPFGVIVVNVEALMKINRLLGREIYERVVAVTSDLMIDAYGRDTVARLAGEDVVILQPDLTEEDATRHAEAAAAVLAGPIEVDGVPFSLDPVAGVSLSPRHGREMGTLLMKAELAAGEARRRGRRASLYVRQAAEVTQRRLEMLRELRTALLDPARRAEVAVVYQPQVNLTTGALHGVEALVRWTHPVWGPVPAEELIEAIEPTEVIHLLTRHMLDTVVGQLRRWNDRGHPVRAAVNVSVQDLHDSEFVDELGAILGSHDVKPSQLTVEITERMLISDAERLAQVARTLAELGVGLSLDDFGTGYASLQQLRLLPLSEVKIDRSYVSGLVDNPADLAIVTSVYELARALGVAVVAEGVEDPRTALALRRLAGTVGQGYLLGRPMSAHALADWTYTPVPERRQAVLRRRPGLWRRSRR